jgi:hypothetical protein
MTVPTPAWRPSPSVRTASGSIRTRQIGAFMPSPSPVRYAVPGCGWRATQVSPRQTGSLHGPRWPSHLPTLPAPISLAPRATLAMLTFPPLPGWTPATFGAQDAVAAASRLLAQGKILAIKGIGGFHLACDASNAQAVAALRQRKGRYRKPFALMARDLEVIRRHALLDETEARLLTSPAAPVVLLEARNPAQEAARVETVFEGSENTDASSTATGRVGWRRAGVSTAGMLSPSLQGCIHGVPRPPSPGPDNLTVIGLRYHHEEPIAEAGGLMASEVAGQDSPRGGPRPDHSRFHAPLQPPAPSPAPGLGPAPGHDQRQPQ